MAACRVTNNYISNCRGHGIILRASGGTVSGNTIVGVTYGAIELAPTFNAVEGAFVKNTVVGPLPHAFLHHRKYPRLL